MKREKSMFCNGCYQTLHFLSGAIPTLLAEENMREYSGMKMVRITQRISSHQLFQETYLKMWTRSNNYNVQFLYPAEPKSETGFIAQVQVSVDDQQAENLCCSLNSICISGNRTGGDQSKQNKAEQSFQR